MNRLWRGWEFSDFNLPFPHPNDVNLNRLNRTRLAATCPPTVLDTPNHDGIAVVPGRYHDGTCPGSPVSCFETQPTLRVFPVKPQSLPT